MWCSSSTILVLKLTTGFLTLFSKYIFSIDHMSEKMRHAIESRQKVKEQMLLDQEDFLVAQVTVPLLCCLVYYCLCSELE